MFFDYQSAVQELLLSLSLPATAALESTTSLQVGAHIYHLTEHPADYLLMFVHVPTVEHALVEEQNLFSQDHCKPVLGLDSRSGRWVLWSRQHLRQMDGAMAQHQLEQLVLAATQLHQPA